MLQSDKIVPYIEMLKHITFVSIFLAACLAAAAQVPMDIQVRILKAEDARRYDKTLEDLIKSPNLSIRHRAALAAGRIGDDAAIPVLVGLLDNEAAINTAAMAAFAIGEIESVKGADALVKTLADPQTPHEVRARALEAAGKIVAANQTDEKSKLLSAAVLNVLDRELHKQSEPNVDVIRLGLTAVLRARPEGAAEIVRPFLSYTDPNIIADALNTLARLRAKNVNRDARDLLQTHTNAIVRANAARVLGAAEDKDAFDVLLKAATEDADPRVRVSAIRSLAALKDARAADKLLERGEKLLTKMPTDPLVLGLLSKSGPAGNQVRNPAEKNELLEIATALGRLLPNSRNERAVKFLDRFIMKDDGYSPEISIARLRVAPGRFSSRNESKPLSNWRQYSTLAQIIGEFAKVETTTDEAKKMKEEAPAMARLMAEAFAADASKEDEKFVKAGPDFLRAFAEYKTDDLSKILRDALKNRDVFIRATAAELLAEQPVSSENLDALNTALDRAIINDTQFNDAVLSILDALFKLDKQKSLSALALASGSLDHLVRQKVLELLKDATFRKVENLPTMLRYADQNHLRTVRPYAGTGTKLGQVLNTDADYRRALLRKNGMVKAIVSTEKGTFTIDLLPEDAPLTVDNFMKLSKANYFNGLEVHRVVPNFVMQDGDPRGDGNGGPGWSIRCEINMVPYERGAVGMALSGKDTGGSQWFVTHSPQPHLDGGYTVFGKVNDAGMKVVDNIVRGDKILSVKIVEGAAARQRGKHR
jgi:cyclophilin family peptidyl-prolyl cis-trans isomerase/HEAT repeat protein